MEVAGQAGPIMVFPHWSHKDMKEAIATLPKPWECRSQKFSEKLPVLIQEIKPTQGELRHLLTLHLGVLNLLSLFVAKCFYSAFIQSALQCFYSD